MKKSILTFTLMLALALFTWSCSDNDSDNPAPAPTALDIVINEYKALVDEFPEAKDHFIEARFTLNKEIAEADDIKAESVEIWCYFWNAREGYSELFVLERDLITGERQTYHFAAESPYMGDKQIPESEMKSLTVSLEKALQLAKNEVKNNKPDSDGLYTSYVTLRKPLYPFWDNPQYVVGGRATRRDHVFIDALNGKVTIDETVLPEGDAMMFLVDDFNTIVDEYGGNGQRMGYAMQINWNLVSVELELNDALDEAQINDFEPIKITYNFYVPADDEHPSVLIKAVRNSLQLGTELEYSEETDVPNPWPHNQFLHPGYTDRLISLEEAITAVKIGPVTDTDTPIVTICQPQGFERAAYEFLGDEAPTVYVDSESGELITSVAQ